MRARFEVEEDYCAACGLCGQTAPGNMELDLVAGHSRVVKQPESDEEEVRCLEAASHCPMGALRQIDQRGAG
jgi:ferredoxin